MGFQVSLSTTTHWCTYDALCIFSYIIKLGYECSNMRDEMFLLPWNW